MVVESLIKMKTIVMEDGDEVELVCPDGKLKLTYNAKKGTFDYTKELNDET